MALKLHGYYDTIIKKLRRCTSLTVLQYIHNQIAHLSKDVSQNLHCTPFPQYCSH